MTTMRARPLSRGLRLLPLAVVVAWTLLAVWTVHLFLAHRVDAGTGDSTDGLTYVLLYPSAILGGLLAIAALLARDPGRSRTLHLAIGVVLALGSVLLAWVARSSGTAVVVAVLSLVVALGIPLRWGWPGRHHRA